MIKCPRCSASLTDWAQTCQFCQTDVKAVARPVAPKPVDRGYRAPTWVWAFYYTIAGWWVFTGSLDVAASLGLFGPDYGSVLRGIIGLPTALVGLGLICNVNLARGIANVMAFLRIILGVLGLIGSLLGTIIFGIWGLVFAFFHIVSIVTGIFMIYLIGETETRTPNV
jgi:hypothetical protein